MRARRQRLGLALAYVVCAASAPVVDAGIPSWHEEHPFPGTGPYSAPQAAINSDGDAAVAWQDSEQNINVAVGPSGGRLGPPQRFGRRGRWAGASELIADTRGRFVLAWSDGECCRVPADPRVWISTRAPGGRFSRPHTPVELQGVTGAPALAQGRDGSVTMAWLASGPPVADPRFQPTVIAVADLLPDGRVGPVEHVQGPEALVTFPPRIATGPSGETVVVFGADLPCESDIPCSDRLYAATRQPGGRFGAPQQSRGPMPRMPTTRGLKS